MGRSGVSVVRDLNFDRGAKVELAVQRLCWLFAKPPMYTVNLMELNANDEVVHERIYLMEGWEAPEWRAPWRSTTPADSVTWD